LFALDLAYEPNGVEKVLQFGPPRESTFYFHLPSSASKAAEVFRVDADGTEGIEHTMRDGVLAIRDRVSGVAIYVVAPAAGERKRIEARRQALITEENAFGFDAGRNPVDLAALNQLLEQPEKPELGRRK
jgi:hypothetical protein